MERAQRRIEDFLNVVRGLQFLQTEPPGAVNDVIAGLLQRAKDTRLIESDDLMAAADDDHAFVDALMRRMAAHQPLRDITLEFAPAPEDTSAHIGAERLDDILTALMEGMVGIGAKHIGVGTRVASGHVEIRLRSRERMDPAAFGTRRLGLYDRTLSWLGGSLARIERGGNTEFLIRVPALPSG